ncbi:uncharacterized protein LOC130636554 [Hydractinia symbiolongicarpus]|uniref:uncharacterized protein LOC130636554 n=1 Tax=Hydractinia symbiolongicarpus TaxID=13093 RepID=UPI00254D4E1E|nr:uncharacterized protein LOC130636554 [Hydractinia symbiolongicarpus]
MIVTETRSEGEMFPVPPVSKKIRSDSTSSTDSHVPDTMVKNLELERVKELFESYDSETAEAVTCVVCGKNYKSKVCVKKHLWEHSVYWDLFDGLKKQQRVLSIQAAIILAVKFNPSLSLLLVTQSSNNNKKKTEKSSAKNFTEKSHLDNTTTSRKRKMDDVVLESSYISSFSSSNTSSSNLNLISE